MKRQPNGKSTDHWWTRSVQSEFWTNNEGSIGRRNVKNETVWKKPSKGKGSKDKTGAINGGHYYPYDVLGSDTSSDKIGFSFEENFNEVDLHALEVLKIIDDWASKLPRTGWAVEGELRSVVPPLDSDGLKKLFHWVAAVYFRSPGYRREISKIAPSFEKDDDWHIALGTLNVFNSWSLISESSWPIKGAVRLDFYRCFEADFIFPDKIEQNLFEQQMRFVQIGKRKSLILSGKIGIPLFPNLLLALTIVSGSQNKTAVSYVDIGKDRVQNWNAQTAENCEEVFFRCEERIGNLPNLERQKGFSGKYHR